MSGEGDSRSVAPLIGIAGYEPVAEGAATV
jgi:hypothetical protein